MELRSAKCECGKVEVELMGDPIIGVGCYCDDCQEGANRIHALDGAPKIMSTDGGTDLILYRKDRLEVVKGSDLLTDMRLREFSPTRRVVANCCNSGMFLDFEKGHWYSVYRSRISKPVPPIVLNIQTKFRSMPDAVEKDIPEYKSYSMGFLVKLLFSRVAMVFSS